MAVSAAGRCGLVNQSAVIGKFGQVAIDIRFSGNQGRVRLTAYLISASDSPVKSEIS